MSHHITSTWRFLFCLAGVAAAMCIAGFASYARQLRAAPMAPVKELTSLSQDESDTFDDLTGGLKDLRVKSRDVIRAYTEGSQL